MKKVQEMDLSKITQQSGESAQISKGSANRETIENLWMMMASMFGHKWTSSYGDQVDPEKVWQASLKGISQDQIKRALNLLAKRGDEWPPSAPEFRSLCLYGDATEEQAAFEKMAERQNKERLALPKLKASKETAKSHLDKIRDGLK